MNENLFSRRFWVGEADARLLALYRALLGTLLLYDASDRLRDFHAFYTERGLLPRAVATAVRSPWAWSIFDMIQPWGLELALYLAGMGALVAMTLGYRTRLATLLSWLFVISIQHRNDLVLDGSDLVLRVMLFWLLFADCGACWSLDVRLGRRAQAQVAAYPLGLLRVQLCLVYLFTTVDKWHGGWWSHNYLYGVMQSYDFARWLGPSLLQFPELCRFLTRGVLVLEGAIPLLFLSPFAVPACRALGLLLHVGLHTSIFLTLAVGNFPMTMLSTSVLFLLPSWLDRVAPLRAMPPEPRRPLRGLWLGAPLLALVITSVASYSFELDLSRTLNQQLEIIGLQQSWPMFKMGLVTQGRWLAPGKLQDGSEVEVFSQVAPGLLTTRAGSRYSRWYKMRFGLGSQRDYKLYDSLGRYLCRRYNGREHGPYLRELEIQYLMELVPGPGEPPAVAVRNDMYSTRCIETEPPERGRPPHSPFISPPQP